MTDVEVLHENSTKFLVSRGCSDIGEQNLVSCGHPRRRSWYLGVVPGDWPCNDHTLMLLLDGLQMQGWLHG